MTRDRPEKPGLGVAVSLKRGVAPRIGLERVAIIEAVDELGSITAAAKRLGLSYKGAWDIVQGLNNLFAAPLIEAAPGGKSGGAARVTDRGLAVVAAFRRVQAEIDAAVAKLEADISGEAARDLFWSLGMRTSARNALRGEITSITEGAVNSEVTLRLNEGAAVTAIVTRSSVGELDLAIGKPAVALIKSSFVMLAKDDGFRTSARNQIVGAVRRREDGAVNSEIALDIGGGKTLTATITLESARLLEIAEGDRMTALIKASHVILAVE